MVLMDEQKEKDDSEAVVKSMDYEGEEGDSCNGDDIMVEVLGSRVYVDGICTTDGGGRFGGDVNYKSGRGNGGSINVVSESRSEEDLSMNGENLKDQQNIPEEKVGGAAEGEMDKEDSCSEDKDSTSLSRQTQSGGDVLKIKVILIEKQEMHGQVIDAEQLQAKIDENESRDDMSPDKHEVIRDENHSDRGEVAHVDDRDSCMDGDEGTDQAGLHQVQEMVIEGDDLDSEMASDIEKVDSGLEHSQPERTLHLKRNHNLKDIMNPTKKERRPSDLMENIFDSLDFENDSDGKANGGLASPSSGKKRKAVDSLPEDSVMEGRKTSSLAKVSPTSASSPKPYFKIGECISRVASQMTVSPSTLKSNDFPGDGYDVPLEDSEMINPLEYSPGEVLSQLHFAACDPLMDYSFSNIVVSFFSEFRNSAVIDRLPVDKAHGTRKFSSTTIGSETFEFEDMNDTYWTDRVVQNGSEVQPPHKGQDKSVPVELGKPIKKTPKNKKRYSDGTNHDLSAAELSAYISENAPAKPSGYISENAPAEIVMNFPCIYSVPSETMLNTMFRHFGPLKDSETEVDPKTNRARVVFKKCSDTEVAFDSAGKFNIFGSVPVNYQLNYVISESFKASSYAPTLAEETHHFGTTKAEHTPPVASTASNAVEGSHPISPTVGGEGPYMVSHFENAPLSMPAPLTEETLHLAISLGEGNFPTVTSLYEETLPSIPTLVMETKDVPLTTYEEASSVVTPIFGESKPVVATTLCEDNSTARTNVGEETLTKELPMDTATAGEGTSSVATTSDMETSVTATLDRGNLAAAITLGDETSTIACYHRRRKLSCSHNLGSGICECCNPLR